VTDIDMKLRVVTNASMLTDKKTPRLSASFHGSLTVLSFSWLPLSSRRVGGRNRVVAEGGFK